MIPIQSLSSQACPALPKNGGGELAVFINGPSVHAKGVEFHHHIAFSIEPDDAPTAFGLL